MSSDDGTNDSGASGNDMTAPATPAVAEPAASSVPAPVSDDASAATLTALADDLDFTLTVGQAIEKYIAARRKVPSLRTMQRYCIEGRVAAQKIRTTYGSEWLINEISLLKLIEAEPVISVAASDADPAGMAAPATPFQYAPLVAASVTAANGDASAAANEKVEVPEGERRRLSDVLIENAKLFAEVEGRDAVISELKDDRTFLREEVREARKTRDDVRHIAERMLDTLKTMALGRLAAGNPPPDPIQADVIDPQHRQQ